MLTLACIARVAQPGRLFEEPPGEIKPLTKNGSWSGLLSNMHLLVNLPFRP